jgi:tetrapyrrole methylase family protein/MazG family protein
MAAKQIRDSAASLQRLLAVMATLRGPAGCPWDREQTHRSLLPYVIEEAYELLDAVEREDIAATKEELGDVLLQVVFHARVAEEAGTFTFADIAADLAAKLVERHPHVFGGEQLPSADAVRHVWEQRKMRTRSSHLEGIPSGLPALQWAGKVASRAATAGFEWNQRGEIFERAAEELEEFRASLEAAGPNAETAGAGKEAAETEFGDLMFALVQVARWSGIDPEAALRRSTRKFIGRFEWMERAARERSVSTAALDAAAWEALWQEAKQSEAILDSPKGTGP